MSQTKAKRKEIYYARKAANICVTDACGNPAQTDRVMCSSCATTYNKNGSKQRVRARELNLCYTCRTRSPEKRGGKCGICIYAAKATFLKLKQSGICVVCKQRPANNKQIHCQTCLDQVNSKRELRRSAGLCIHCDRPTLDGTKTQCEICRVKDTLVRSRANAKLNNYKPITMPTTEFISWYRNKVIESNGLCAWCKEPFRHRRMIVDHDHKTGEPRALVCNLCNSVEGFGIDRLEKVLAAMKAWAARPAPASKTVEPASETAVSSPLPSSPS
jgi:Recombination endonuclease VII